MIKQILWMSQADRPKLDAQIDRQLAKTSSPIRHLEVHDVIFVARK